MKEVLISNNTEINNIIAYQLEGSGKMIRPRLVYLAASLAPHNPAVVRDVAVAVELIHMASLIHDDVIDHAPLRRGRESINSRWGNQASVLTGDYLFATAFNLINRHSMLDIMENITDTIRIMCAGEIRQMALAYNLDISENDYLAKTHGKTACLFASACTIGALAAYLPPDNVKALEQFGLSLGYAYQIMDDLLDFLSDSSILGKPTGSDLMEGNITLPVIYALQHQKYGPWLRTLLSKRKLTGKQLEKVIKVLKDSGAVDDCLKRVEHFIKKSEDCLRSLPPGPVREEFQALADYLQEDYYHKLNSHIGPAQEEAAT
jgi:heptaprenyl diphosphate synthase